MGEMGCIYFIVRRFDSKRNLMPGYDTQHIPMAPPVWHIVLLGNVTASKGKYVFGVINDGIVDTISHAIIAKTVVVLVFVNIAHTLQVYCV